MSVNLSSIVKIDDCENNPSRLHPVFPTSSTSMSSPTSSQHIPSLPFSVKSAVKKSFLVTVLRVFDRIPSFLFKLQVFTFTAFNQCLHSSFTVVNESQLSYHLLSLGHEVSLDCTLFVRMYGDRQESSASGLVLCAVKVTIRSDYDN